MPPAGISQPHVSVMKRWRHSSSTPRSGSCTIVPAAWFGHPHDVMLEALAVGDLDVDEHEPNPVALVETALAVHRPSHPADCTRCARARFHADVGYAPAVNRRAMSQAPTEVSEPPAPEPPAPESPVASDRYRARPSSCSWSRSSSRSSSTCTISRPMWFYLDEWDFLANRTGVQPRRSVPRAQRALGDAARARVPRAVVGLRPATATGRTNSSSCCCTSAPRCSCAR